MNCIKCNKPATQRWSPDIDIKGIAFCNDCKEDVITDILLVQLGEKTWEWFEKKYKL